MCVCVCVWGGGGEDFPLLLVAKKTKMANICLDSFFSSVVTWQTVFTSQNIGTYMIES